MELTASFSDLLQQFSPVFTAPTYQTFLAIVAGWVLSQRHRFITEVIFSSGNVGNGHWSRFHRFFSHAAWDIDTFSMALAKLAMTVLAPGAILHWAVDDTLCRKRGSDPLRRRHALRPAHLQPIQGLGQLGTRLGRPEPARRPPLLGTHQGLCLADRRPAVHQPPGAHQGKEEQREIGQGQDLGQSQSQDPPAKTDPNHRTRPELALELIRLVARWFPDDQVLMLGDSAYGGRSVLSHLPPNVHLISRVHPKGALYEPAPPKIKGTRGPARKKGDRLPGMAEWAEDPEQPWTRLDFNRFGLHASLSVKTKKALYYKSGRDRLLTIVLVRDLQGKRPDQMFYCTELDWTAREILSAYACRWAIECTFEFCKQFLGLEDPANRLPKAVERTAPMALFIYTIVVVWFHRTGHESLRFPFRPWYTKKEEPSFADMLTTLRRLSYDEKTAGLLPKLTRLETWIAQLTELLSRTG